MVDNLLSCRLSLLLGLALLRGFFSLHKNQHFSQFQFYQEEDRRFVSVHTVTRLPSINIVLYIIYIVSLHKTDLSVEGH